MTREEFLEKSIMLGVGSTLLSSLSGIFSRETNPFFQNINPEFKEKIIIIGAGAAGMAAGFLLTRYGVDFQILEASSDIGGRLKKSADFADFPLDLGAEWIHTDPSILSEIARNPDMENKIETIEYSPKTIQTWKKGKLRSRNFIGKFYSEWKFKNSTWFDFFERHISPHFRDKILFNQVVNRIDYTSGRIKIETETGETYHAEKLLLTVPINILQSKTITFYPELPPEKKQAIDSVFMGDGIKIFVEFTQRFYPDILTFGNIFKAMKAEELFIYDAAFGKGSEKHILGLFAINEEARAYTQLATEEEIIEKFLSRLD